MTYLKKLDRLVALCRWEMDDQIGIDENQKVEQQHLYKELKEVLKKV